MERIKKYELLWGKWTVKRIIGEGSFGAVYEVESEKFGNKSSCAVKLISFKNAEMLQGVKDGETLSSEELEQLKIEEAKKNVREAVLMEKLQGRDHIVEIHDYEIFPGESTTDVIIRMELLMNLNDYMKICKIKSENDLKRLVIKLGVDIGRALEECEEEKIVHRDIKPDNIFVNKNGTFKLGDFGLSLKMSKSASFSLRKSAGTPLYMAPEALGWGNKSDYQSDMYSLGIVMYQLLNDGNIPYVLDMRNYDEVYEAIGKRAGGEEILPPEHENEQLWRIIQKTCQFKKTDRYQNVKDSVKELVKLLYKIEEDTADKQQYRIGDSVFFGNYPQDKNEAVEPIEWNVLKIEENKVLLLSKYILDTQPYNKYLENVTWETSDIRRWLNRKFYKVAFSNMEKKKIVATWIITKNNSEWGTDGGNNTKDKVFLLSVDEEEELCQNREMKMSEVTEYAKKIKIRVGEKTGCSDWWLRSPGSRNCRALHMFDGGNTESIGAYVHDQWNGVRPAIWVNIESFILN